MCNLYRMTSNADAIRQLFGPHLGAIEMEGINLPSFEGVYPGHDAPVLCAVGEGARLTMMRWGWPPFGQVKRPITNVRNLQSPLWRSALRDPVRRCLVLATAFCEYSAAPDPVTKRKRQHWFALASREPFAFAGIWRPVDEGACFAFLTCPPNQMVGAVHPKAMPVMLAGPSVKQWLEGAWDDVEPLVAPFPDIGMQEIDPPPEAGTGSSQLGLFG
jgi:putative SOS response-associated peptidase YedK